MGRSIRTGPAGSSSAGQTGSYHFNLVTSNGEVIATSESYQSKASALNEIESVQRNAAGADIDDQIGGE
jgi:uncharacterized protein